MHGKINFYSFLLSSYFLGYYLSFSNLLFVPLCPKTLFYNISYG